MEAKVFSVNGKEIKTIELNPDVFGIEVSDGSIYHAVNNELANRRVGTACTKTRAEVNYSNTKPFKQKGTGNARRGDKKSPVMVGGGTIFGPKPRDYSYTLPKKVKRLAMRSLLSLSVQEERLVVVEDFTSENGKTKELVGILKNFVEDGKRTVLIMKNDDAMLRRAARNIPYLHVLAYDKLSAKELLYGKKVVMLETAAKNLNEFYGD
ncbi:MAG: 50S ribosomal protein L4 [Spirochaetales bacterium]|jgi:large subunit ribosomal protein L4|nr:50S ribosomal protein L4 [Spirochaetales bacterium]MCR5442999.1 50S ribosomal protein L4 [Sphaerochaetaceae bacterium]MBQ3698102.1 50S ribosomal protein L4 [Spirochaetales bacterium]MBQ3727914.1 50S ribosomal protein L4 [Spirochaetales bacterium]MBQ3829983.1 50S ribosomal protein L4 [Spirochaetales bacterium]